jgi:hypothetical protein
VRTPVIVVMIVTFLYCKWLINEQGKMKIFSLFCFMVFNATFNNISVLLVEETGGLGENHQPVASHWQIWTWNESLKIYNCLCNQCLSPLMRVWILIRVRCTTLCDKVCQWLATGWWFSPSPPVSSTNKTEIFVNL